MSQPSSQPSSAAPRTVLRQRGAVVVPVVVWVFCAAVAVTSIVQDHAADAVATVIVMLIVADLGWLVLARPCFVVDDEGLTVVNPVRTHRVPFGALDEVKVGGLAVVFARTRDRGLRRITSWNAPGVPRRHYHRRPNLVRDSFRTASTPTSIPSPTSLEVARREGRWRARHPDGAGDVTAVTTVAWQAWIPVLLLVTALIAIRLR